MTEKKSSSAGKGRATPSRKKQESANVRPLVGNRSPEAIKAQKAKAREERMKARAGMAAGEEKYLTARDRGPQRKFVRDYVDSKFSLGQLVVPTMFVVILVSIIPIYIVQLGVLIAMWTLFISVGINAAIFGRGAVKMLEAKYGASKVERGLKWYAAMRTIQMRGMRLPKPQVKRGANVAP